MALIKNIDEVKNHVPVSFASSIEVIAPFIDRANVLIWSLQVVLVLTRNVPQDAVQTMLAPNDVQYAPDEVLRESTRNVV